MLGGTPYNNNYLENEETKTENMNIKLKNIYLKKKHKPIIEEEKNENNSLNNLLNKLKGQNSIIKQNSKDCIDQKCIIYNNNKIINNNNNKNDNQINGKNTDIIYNNNCSFSGSFSFHFGNSGASKISDPFYKTPENSNFFSYNSHNSQQNSIQSSNKSNIMSTNMDTENIFNHINNDNNSKDNI